MHHPKIRNPSNSENLYNLRLDQQISSSSRGLWGGIGQTAASVFRVAQQSSHEKKTLLRASIQRENLKLAPAIFILLVGTTCSIPKIAIVSPVNWALRIVIIALDIWRNRVGSGEHFNPLFLIASSVFNLILVGILAFKIRCIYWTMTKNPATYYEGIHVNKIRQEIKIAEEELRIRGESQRRTAAPANRFEILARFCPSGLRWFSPLFSRFSSCI